MFVGIVMYIYTSFKDLEVNREYSSLDKDKKYILISNHRSKLDAFLIPTFIPFKSLLGLFPFLPLIMDRFLVKTHMRVFLLYWCGSVSTNKKRNNGIKTLEKIKIFMDEGRTPIIFPEGEINKSTDFNKEIDLGIGAIYLEKKDPSVYLLPVKVEYLPKKKIKITYKKPFRHKKFPKDLQPLIKETMKNLYQ